MCGTVMQYEFEWKLVVSISLSVSRYIYKINQSDCVGVAIMLYCHKKLWNLLKNIALSSNY